MSRPDTTHHSQSTDPLNQYYKNLTHAISQPQLRQHVTNQLHEANTSILQKLETGKVAISDKAADLNNNGSQHNPSPHIEHLKQILQKKKHMMLKELEELEKKQQQLKQSRYMTEILHNKTVPANVPSKERSEFSKQDAKMMRKLNMKLKKFEEQLEKKTKEIEQDQINMKKDQKEENAKKLKENTAQRDEILRKLEEIKKQQEQRKQQFLEREKQYNEAKAKEKLFMELEKKFQEKERQKEEEKEKIRSKIKKEQVVDYEGIKQHSRKYDEIIKKQKEERQNRICNKQQPSKTDAYHRNRLFQVITEEEALRKSLQREKAEQAKMVAEKRAIYARAVKLEHMPKVTKNPLAESNRKSTPEIKPLTFAETVKKGNQNLKESKALLKKVDTSTTSPYRTVKVEEQKPFKYRNYLVHKTNQTKSELDLIKQIVGKENQPSHQRFKEAKQIADKILDKPGNNNQQIIKSINAKLEILKKMYE